MRERTNITTPAIKVSVTSPEIKIEENKATSIQKYIKGTITNNTGEHLRNKFIQFDFYNADGKLIDTESQEIKILNIDEKNSFKINYKYKNVDKIEINFVDEVIDYTKTA